MKTLPFRDPLRDPLRGRVPSQNLSGLLPLILLPLKPSPTLTGLVRNLANRTKKIQPPHTLPTPCAPPRPLHTSSLDRAHPPVLNTNLPPPTCPRLLLPFRHPRTETDLFSRLPELCGQVHPETAPPKAVHLPLCSTEQSTFRGREKAKKCREKERKRGGQKRGQKGKKDVRKQVRKNEKKRKHPKRPPLGIANLESRACLTRTDTLPTNA